MAKNELNKRNPLHLSRLSGATFTENKAGQHSIKLSFLNREINISWPSIGFQDDSSNEIPIKQKILILHYMLNCKGSNLKGEWISYKDIPSARFYLSAFNKRVKLPLIGKFGEQPEKLDLLAKEMFGAEQSFIGDASILIQAFPYVPVNLVIWKGDDEFTSDGTILFDESIKDILSPEDITELVSMIIYPLLSKAG